MELQEAQEIVDEGEQIDDRRKEAAEVVRIAAGNAALERREAQSQQRKEDQIAECEQVLKALEEAEKAIADLSTEALYRCGASATHPRMTRPIGASEEESDFGPATTGLPMMLRLGIAAARDRLTRLRAD